MKVVVLSGKYAETKRFVKAMNLPPTTPHLVNSDRLRSLRGDVEVHVLPSYAERRDQGAIETQLRHAERRGSVVRYYWECDAGAWSPVSGAATQHFASGEWYVASDPEVPPLQVLEEAKAMLETEDPTDDDLDQRFGVVEEPDPEPEHGDFLAWLDEHDADEGGR